MSHTGVRTISVKIIAAWLQSFAPRNSAFYGRSHLNSRCPSQSHGISRVVYPMKTHQLTRLVWVDVQSREIGLAEQGGLDQGHGTSNSKLEQLNSIVAGLDPRVIQLLLSNELENERCRIQTRLTT